ncbi:MAG: porin family protein [Mesorhizobium sp.]|nr:outer membrane protein [Mesorhizobium sp.]MBL8578801.1 porin family protein [Mesorhizobium sp.]
MKKLLIALAASLMAGTAFAADAIVEEVVVDVPVGFNWTGGYIGAQAGYLWGDGDFVSPAGNVDIGMNGWLGGVYVGYNYQFTNSVVLGIDADYAWSGADDSSPSNGVPGTLDTELEWEGAVRARLGYAMDRFLPYIAGGVAFGRLQGDVFNGSGTYVGSDADTNVGWTVGVGGEYAFTDNFIGRVEYRYTDLGEFDGTVAGVSSTTDFSTNDVRVGIAYKF